MYLFVDTETTGVTPSDRIVSICWSVYDGGGAHLHTTYRVVRPDGFTIPYGAFAIHGISTEHAQAVGVPLADALNGFCASVVTHGPRLCVAHNVDFDRPMILGEYRRMRLAENFSLIPTYCTMKRTADVCRIPGRYGHKWPKLDELHRHLFRAPHTRAHNAEDDVKACAKCFFELKARGFVRE